MSTDFEGKWVEYDLGEGTFAITSYEKGQQPGARGASIGFEVAALDGFVKMLKQNGVPFALEIFETPVCRFAVIEDPDKNHITIHKRH